MLARSALVVLVLCTACETQPALPEDTPLPTTIATAPLSTDSTEAVYRVTLAGAERPVTVVYPAGYDSAGAYPVLLSLPPQPGTTAMVEASLHTYWRNEGRRRGYLVVSPEILGPNLRDYANDIVPGLFAWMETTLAVDTERVAVTGASNGGIGTFEVLTRHPERFAAAITLPGYYNGHRALDGLADTPVWLLVGEQDNGWLEASRQTTEALEQVGAEVSLTVLPGQGHSIHVPPSELFDWLDEALAR